MKQTFFCRAASCTVAAVIAIVLLAAVSSRAEPAQSDGIGPSAEGRNGMVVCVSAPAASVGREVLQRGGNAVDAACAVAFALAVTWPEAGNLGGGGFMMIHLPGKAEPVFIDYRETAPAAATRDMFAKTERPSSYLLAGVPGTVRGLALAHQRHGKLPWKDLLQPAIKLAQDGFVLDKRLAGSLNALVAVSPDFPELRRVYGQPGGWKAGDRLVQSDLAKTLRQISEQGPDAFYKGPIAEQIVAEMKRGGGLISSDDLAGYQAKVRAPIHGTYRGYHIYGPPPPSSGGICLVEMLNILEHFDLRKEGRWSPETLHRVIEAMRRAYCDRARYLGDPDFVTIPSHLISKDHARKLAEGIEPSRATASAALAKDIPLAGEGSDTTHFSVIDRDGKAVSNTYTLEQSFGGRIVVRGAGFLLNNEMGDFNPRPGVTDRRGRIGTPPNLVAPGKRMLSSMTPVLVTRDGKVVLITGSPGGRTIINTVLCVVLNVLEFEMPLRDAIDAPRMHHAWFPDRVQMERGLHKDHAQALETLKKWGHAIDWRSELQGDAHSILVDPRSGRYIGEADRRRSGAAAGY
jgi:gamma-glutamyltranspeptidase/glutathione hydrolase